MGAELVVQYLFAKRGELKNELNKCRKRIAKLKSKDEVKGLFDVWDDDDAERAELADVKRVLRGDVETCELGVAARLRCGVVLTICEYDVLLSGGETWGDSPSDLFDSIQRIEASGLFEFPKAKPIRKGKKHGRSR